MKSVKLLLLVASTSLFLAACSESTPAPEEKKDAATAATTEPAPTANIDEFASAKKIYKEMCSECHKEDGTGGRVDVDGKNIRVPDLTSAKVKRLSDETYLKYIRNGDEEEGMPAFKDKLSNEEMVALVKLIRRDIQGGGAESGKTAEEAKESEKK